MTRTDLTSLLEGYVEQGALPGAVALVAREDGVDVAAVGTVDVEGTAPMARDSLFRIASLTKMMVAAALLMLVDDGRLALDDPVARWLPELASPTVLRTPQSPLDDVVPARRPIAVRGLLDARAGYGFPSDFSLAWVEALFELEHGPLPQGYPAPDEWLARLAAVPLLDQPGETWLYNTTSHLQGILVARVAGASLGDVLAERIFVSLGMSDTSFVVPADKVARMTAYYRPGEDGLELVDPPDGEWSRPVAFESGAGGLVSTVDDCLAFSRLVLGGGEVDGRRLVSADAVRLMTTDHLTAAQRRGGALFLEGQGWGFGGSVDVNPVDPWVVPGRYGWVGGTGTSAHIVPSTGTVSILLTQIEMSGPTTPQIMHDFWTYAAGT